MKIKSKFFFIKKIYCLFKSSEEKIKKKTKLIDNKGKNFS